MAVTVELNTAHHNRRGEYITGTYHARRVPDFPAALAVARAHWQQHARQVLPCRITYRGDNGTIVRRAELRAG